jgi:hypothetical protein
MSYPKLKSKDEEGVVVFPKEFDQMDGLWKKDLLRDWIYALQEKYDNTSIWED